MPNQLSFEEIARNSSQPSYAEHYRDLNLLGNGGQALCFRCQRISDGKEFCCKRYHEGLECYFHRELQGCKTASSADNAVVELVDCFPRERILVFELARGGDLFNKMEELMAADRVVIIKIVRRLLSALACLAEQGHVHMDLKFDNVLIMNDDDLTSVKLADFGFCCAANDVYPRPQPLGTIGYIAPELHQFAALAWPSSSMFDNCPMDKCDVWSLGTMLFCLASRGYAPFLKGNRQQLVMGNRAQHPQTVLEAYKHGTTTMYHIAAKDHEQTCDKQLMDVAVEMLEVDPRKRPSAAQLLEDPRLQLPPEEGHCELMVQHRGLGA